MTEVVTISHLHTSKRGAVLQLHRLDQAVEHAKQRSLAGGGDGAGKYASLLGAESKAHRQSCAGLICRNGYTSVLAWVCQACLVCNAPPILS